MDEQIEPVQVKGGCGDMFEIGADEGDRAVNSSSGRSAGSYQRSIRFWVIAIYILTLILD